MMGNQLFIVITTVVLMFTFAGCERIEEPWISGDEDLKQQRTRTMLQAENLRERLIYTQADR